MPNGWAPNTGEEMIGDIYQRLRILARHRHPKNFGEIPGAIDASGGIDVSPATDNYTEGPDDAFPAAAPPIQGTPPPQGQDAGPVQADGTDITPPLGTVQGITRALVTATVHTTGGGESTLVPSEWRFTDMDNTDGADIGADVNVDKRIIVNNPGWYELFLYASIDLPSAPAWMTASLDWISSEGNFIPITTVYSTAFLLTSLPSRKFWLNGGGWITCTFQWGSTVGITSQTIAIDVTRIA